MNNSTSNESLAPNSIQAKQEFEALKAHYIASVQGRSMSALQAYLELTAHCKKYALSFAKEKIDFYSGHGAISSILVADSLEFFVERNFLLELLLTPNKSCDPEQGTSISGINTSAMQELLDEVRLSISNLPESSAQLCRAINLTSIRMQNEQKKNSKSKLWPQEIHWNGVEKYISDICCLIMVEDIPIKQKDVLLQHLLSLVNLPSITGELLPKNIKYETYINNKLVTQKINSSKWLLSTYASAYLWSVKKDKEQKPDLLEQILKQKTVLPPCKKSMIESIKNWCLKGKVISVPDIAINPVEQFFSSSILNKQISAQTKTNMILLSLSPMFSQMFLESIGKSMTTGKMASSTNSMLNLNLLGAKNAYALVELLHNMTQALRQVCPYIDKEDSLQYLYTAHIQQTYVSLSEQDLLEKKLPPIETSSKSAIGKNKI